MLYEDAMIADVPLKASSFTSWEKRMRKCGCDSVISHDYSDYVHAHANCPTKILKCVIKEVLKEP